MIAKNRINSVTKLQSIGILLVVIGHSFPTQDVSQYPPVIAWIQHFIYSFHMPLFMFVSGFLFMLTNRDRDIVYHRFVLTKAKRLFVPYLVLSSLAYIIKINMWKLAWRSIDPGFGGYMQGLLYPLNNPIILYWFLPTLFLIFLIAPAIKKIMRIDSITVTLFFLILISILNIYNPTHIRILNISGALNYLVYFFAGCAVCYYFRENLHKIGSWYIVLALLALLVFESSITVTVAKDLFGLLFALTGIAFSVSLAHFIDRVRPAVFKSFDGYSYQIFLLSWFPQVSIRVLYQMNFLNYYVTIALMLLAGLYIPVIIAKIVEKRLPKLKVLIGLN